MSEPARALEARYYTDPEQLNIELDSVFRRCWQFAGHMSRLPNPGDFFAFRLHGKSLFCVRDRDGDIRTFYNVCVHRGHELVSGSGNKRMLVCPYHSWAYELNGRLRGAPGTDQVVGFDRSTICLPEVRTDVVGGFIFVNLDRDAAGFDEWYPGVRAGLDEFVPDLDVLVPIRTHEVAEQCNWKVSVENYSECYHCRLNHPTFSNGVVDADSYNIVPYGHVLQHVTRSVDVGDMSYALDPNSHPRALEYTSWFLWPTFSFQVYPGNVLNTYCWDAVDHRNTRVIRQWFSPHGEPNEAVEQLAAQDLDTTVAEDVVLVEAVQRGLESGGYTPAPLVVNPAGGVLSEHSIQALNGWLLNALERNAA